MDYVDLTEEQKAKISACKGPEDLLALAKEEGVELTEEQLSQVAGGWETKLTCPKCGSNRVNLTQGDIHSAVMVRDCLECGYRW